MFKFATIKTAFDELVGYKEENEITLSASQKTSNSGFYVNDISGISLQNINESLFIKANLSKEKTVTQYLTTIADAELLNLITNFLKTKENILKTQKLIRDFDFIDSYQIEKLGQTGGFKGFMFRFKNSRNLAGTLESVSLQLDTTDTVKIYLYDLQIKTPIKTFDYTVSEDLTQEFQSLTDWLVKYQDDNGSGRTYLIGYYDYDSSNPLPSHQLSENTQSYRLDFNENYAHKLTYFDYVPIVISDEYCNYNSVLGVYDVPETDGICYNSYSYGLNVRMSFDVDYTDIIIKYKNLFAEALAYQLALRIANDCKNTNEFNHVTESNREAWEKLTIELENKLKGYELINVKGEIIPRKGLLTEIVEELEGLDIVSLPKRRRLML